MGELPGVALSAWSREIRYQNAAIFIRVEMFNAPLLRRPRAREDGNFVPGILVGHLSPNARLDDSSYRMDARGNRLRLRG